MDDNRTHDPGEDRAPEEEQGENEDFGSLFESYMTQSTPEIRVGEKLTGEIIVIGQDSVFLNTGSKIDGVIEKSELLDENGEFPYKVGDRLELYVVAKNEDGIQLSKAIGKTSSADLLYDARKNRIPVEGKILETCKGGFRVQVMGKTAFCPISQIDVSYVEKPEDFVGETREFLIDRIEAKGRNIVVNRRKLLEKLLAEERKKFLAEKSEGDVVEGKVVRIMPYGAFVELHPGVEGMIHISELSWSRVEDPAEAVHIGMTLPVKILSISESDAKAGGVKISLSAKQAAADPWEKAPERYKSGDKIEGRVTRCASFGAFVEVEPGIEGLVHISEMSHHKRVIKAEDVVQPGERVTATVKSIDPANRRMSLSIKDAEGDPWTAFENRIAVGQNMEGRIEKKADFGYFINLAPGITGLLPKSKIDKAPDPASIEKLKADDSISVKIEAIERSDRKITLAPADTMDRTELEKYTAAEPHRGSSSGMGDLGRKLEEALKSKK